MKLNRLFQTTAILAVVFAFVGCDDEFTDIGGEIITNPSNVEVREVEVNAYSQKINSIQTNNLSNHILGVYNHPVYGEKTASLVSQLTLSTENPDFGDNVELDSVVMTIPYFYSEIEDSANDEVLYELDSLYGSESFRLSVYETSYFLNDLDPELDFERRQAYYSDQQNLLEQNIVGEAIFVEENFKPSSASFTTYELDPTGENDTIVNTPALRLKLPQSYFQEKIIDKEGTTDLLNNGNFRNYLRNFFIKAEPNGSGGSQVMLDFSAQSRSPRVSIYYTRDSDNVPDGEEPERIRDSFSLLLSGNRFNTFEGDFPADVNQAVNAQDSETGAENLYLNAQEGSMAVIELFPEQAVLDDIINEELLVNEADLVFYVNDALMGEGGEPRRLYLYDLSNNNVIGDFAIDPSFNPGDPEASLTNFSEVVAEDDTGKFYKIRVTNHVSGIINDGRDNVKLGLVIVPNINAVAGRDSQGRVLGPLMSATRGMTGVIDRVPSVNSLTPTGTIIHGNQSGDADKRLKLRIYYTNYN